MKIHIKLFKSPLKNKKYRMLFYVLDNNKKLQKTKHTDFGGVKTDGTPHSDFTMHKDEARKDRCLMRHVKNNEDWSKFLTAGASSRWMSWNKPNTRDALEDHAKKFGLTLLN